MLNCRKCILDLKPYVPGKPIEEVKRELGIDDIIKLASNENPFGPSPKAVEAMKNAAESMSLYPDGSCFELRNVMAAHLSVQPDMLIFGAGGDEVIFHLAMAFVSPGSEIIQADPTFSEYGAASKIMDANIISVPLTNCTHNLPAMLDRVNERTRLFVVSNPNNPTGTIVPADEVERILDKLPEQCILLLDEAYYEYVDDPAYTRSIEWAIQGRNVLVLRTFSKIYGLAGLRVGYGIAPKHIIDPMERVRMPFNVNSMAQAAAIASLADPGQVIRSRKQNKRSKEYFYAQLARLGIDYAPTQANFIWIDVGKDSQWVFMELLKRGVIVRTGDVFGCPTHIRVTTGTDAQNERFIATLAEVLGK